MTATPATSRGAGRDVARALERLNRIAHLSRKLAEATLRPEELAAAEDFECAAEALAALATPRPVEVTDELTLALAATSLVAEAFAMTQPDRGDVFSWIDDHRHALARAALRAQPDGKVSP